MLAQSHWAARSYQAGTVRQNDSRSTTRPSTTAILSKMEEPGPLRLGNREACYISGAVPRLRCPRSRLMLGSLHFCLLEPKRVMTEVRRHSWSSQGGLAGRAS